VPTADTGATVSSVAWGKDRAVETATQQTAPGPLSTGDRVRSARIVVVDDQPTNARLLQKMLLHDGFSQVSTVTDPREAVRHCCEVGADIVLLDLQMPFVDGYRVMADLRTCLPDGAFVPVLVLTADSTPATRDRALAEGANDFLTKPFDRTEVLLRVRNLLETRAAHKQLAQMNEALREDLERWEAADRTRLEEDRRRRARIDDVLRDGRLRMVFQPIIELATGNLHGLEALARFDVRPAQSPDRWFAEAAAVGRSTDLELAAVAAALRELPWFPAGVLLTLNVSAETAVSDGLVRLLAEVPPGRVVLELTEHAPVRDYAELASALRSLRDRGIGIAVDDAGAGYAGLQHVLRLHPDVVKLDLELIRDVDTDRAKRALVSAMASFAADIGAIIVAEGIETAAELAVLRELGVGCGQGYHLGRPAELSSLSRALAS
jgi:EAL domain-containing protein (putative c-di-GMP-specific phosphodiesterase class I)